MSRFSRGKGRPQGRKAKDPEGLDNDALEPESQGAPGAVVPAEKPAPPFLKRIIGVDPGTIHTGYGIIEVIGSALRPITYGRISPNRTLAIPWRLKYIFEKLSLLIATHKPQAMSLEKIFAYKNQSSAFKLAESRGIALVCGAIGGLFISEYSTTMVKNAVCGYGSADKKQVSFMVSKLLAIEESISMDASDALALAICHLSHANSLNGAARIKGKSFRNLSPEDLVSMGYKLEGA
ncbi:MAG: crossover junction endodeoxyribonuclease RuvC [Deltaproteobacteria bacterium]|jgi:crossover junction endodeoxyribonuclease RuvC|nr:crossover junction endodeoxyribonuclease RuvC [Deltaproteobacteria bacterium]